MPFIFANFQESNHLQKTKIYYHWEYSKELALGIKEQIKKEKFKTSIFRMFSDS